jgi:hypothetical protein
MLATPANSYQSIQILTYTIYIFTQKLTTRKLNLISSIKSNAILKSGRGIKNL